MRNTEQLGFLSLTRLVIRIVCSFILIPPVLSAQIPVICNEALQAHRDSQFAQAAEAYRQCLLAQPGNFEARSNYGAVLVQLGRFQNAIDSYRQALSVAPAPAQDALRRNLALAYYKFGQIPEAAAELLQLYKANPSDRQTRLLLADCYLLMGEPLKTVGILDVSGLPSADDPAADYLLGTALIRSGNVARGKVVIDRILSRSDSAESHMLLGASMFEARDYPGSVAEFSKAVEIDAQLPLAYSYLGRALLITGDANAAVDAFQKALVTDLNDFEANLQLGEILVARAQFADAKQLLERAVTVRPASPDAHRDLAQCLSKTGSAEKAKAEWAWLAEHGFPKEDSDVSGPSMTGKIAPALSLVRHGSKQRVTLADYTRKSAVLLVFASYSCPQFRAQVDKLNALYDRFGARVPFLLVYISEAHAGDAWQSTINQREGIAVPQPKTIAEKEANADLCIRKLRIKFSAAIDDVDGSAEKAYAAWPSRVFLIDRRNRIAFDTHLDEQEFRAEALEQALRQHNNLQ